MPSALVNGIKINYIDKGQGEPLVLISGAGSALGDWKAQIKEFQRLFRTIAFDNRGVGSSDKPPGPYSVKMMADDAIGLMNHLGIEKANIMGVSMGGMIAQEIAINYPERVDKVILGWTFAGRDKVSGFCDEFDKAVEEYLASARGRADQRQFANYLVGSIFNKQINRLFLPPLMRTMFMFYLPRGVVHQFEALFSFNAVDRLWLIKAPTLVVTGTMDRVIKPVSSEVIANLVPNSRLFKLPGGGHMIHQEMASVFNREVLSFLGN